MGVSSEVSPDGLQPREAARSEPNASVRKPELSSLLSLAGRSRPNCLGTGTFSVDTSRNTPISSLALCG